MATYLTTIQVGSKKYHISYSGDSLYFSSSNKTGGSTLKGLKFKNNEIVFKSNSKVATEFDIAEAIKKSSSSSGGCFISTVVYQTINADDNCEELMKLRQFRDEVMLVDSEYSKLVEEYYEISPDIAYRLDKKNDIDLCQYLVDKYIQKSINLIDSHQYEKAIMIYKSMIDYLGEVLPVSKK